MKTSESVVWDRFQELGWGDLWCPGSGPECKAKGAVWFAGVWTGPQHDLICLKKCDTNEEANIWLSPSGRTPEEAVQHGIEKWKALAKGQQTCHRCGFVGHWPSRLPGDWCPKCDAEYAE